MLPVSRKEAKAKGVDRYFTGIPCKRGHLGERYTANGNCLVCSADYEREHPADPEQNRARARKWQRDNPERARERLRRWRARHPEKLADDLKRLNAKYRRASNVNRKARKKGNGGKVTQADLDAIRRKQKGRCANCKKRAKSMEYDHITPLAKGGRHEATNLQYLCATCNRRKGTKDPVAWAQEHGRLL